MPTWWACSNSACEGEVASPARWVSSGGLRLQGAADLLQARYEALRDGCNRRLLLRAPAVIDYLRAGGANLQHLFGADSTTSETQSEANIAGRQGLLRMLRFLKTLPGCEKVRIARMYPMAAIRETYRIVGETTITREDYLSGRRVDDAVAYTFYFIDVHTEEGTDHEFLEEGVVPTLPLGALVPKGSQRLLVAGRTVSSDRRANSALRVEASCMAMGQAAGAAAALGVRQGVLARRAARPPARYSPRSAAPSCHRGYGPQGKGAWGCGRGMPAGGNACRAAKQGQGVVPMIAPLRFFCCFSFPAGGRAPRRLSTSAGSPPGAGHRRAPG